MRYSTLKTTFASQSEKRADRTNIKSLNLTIPHHKIANIRQHAAHEHIIINRDALSPNGTALLGRFLGVVFQGDGRRFGVFNRRVGFVAAVGPVWGDQGGGWFRAGGVMILDQRFGSRALHPLEICLYGQPFDIT